ncbi:DUF2306 domain-containing protein [Cohnella endophytica]|uniref:DUF2306 domain-containing protein n=1 Tax=Cohnella endophytica TaxID=2419778 RepID=A0A494XTY0_9BACL|nr:DUF2306 domain-containing protein [Cohnella endophytica]RKP51549.1 DUF2306 domain-containing protein [Cohnella endophytica]
MRITRNIFIFLFAFLIVAYAVIQYGFYDPKLAGLVQYKLKSPDFHVTPWVYFLYAHIVTGSMALLIGPFQIFRKQSNPKAKSRHRRWGKIYVACIFVSGLINIYLSMFASGGWVARTGFFTMDLVWMYATYAAVERIMKKDIQGHRGWMLRSYAITFAAVTLRLYQVPLMFVWEFESAYKLSAWLCWTLNLVAIEIAIRYKAAKRQAAEASLAS